MLIPAIIKKNEIIKKCQEKFYSEDMLYLSGSPESWIPNIREKDCDGTYQYAIMNNEQLIGFLEYYIDFYSSVVSRFGLISFDKGNIIIGRDLYSEMQKIINEYHIHRIEYQMVSGNPVEKSYDRFCKKYNGTKHIFKDCFKDKYGKYHDNIVYEIILNK